MTAHLIVTDDDATRVITMRRPEKKNALTQDMYRAMSDAIDTAQNNPAIRCIVITGGSGVFTAGNDLDDFLKDGTSDGDKPRASNAAKFLYSLAHNTKPLVAAVDGIAIGIGTTMLFHCDQVLVSTTATFSTPFIHLGLVPEGASSLLAPRTMGHQRAFAMLVMGRTLSADEARDAGGGVELAGGRGVAGWGRQGRDAAPRRRDPLAVPRPWRRGGDRGQRVDRRRRAAARELSARHPRRGLARRGRHRLDVPARELRG